MIQKLKQKVYKVAPAISSIMATSYVMMSQVYAATDQKSSKYAFDDTLTFATMTDSILDIIFTIIKIVGAAWAVMGFVKVVSSFKDDRPEDMKGGVASMVAGICLVIAPSVLKQMKVLK